LIVRVSTDEFEVELEVPFVEAVMGRFKLVEELLFANPEGAEVLG